VVLLVGLVIVAWNALRFNHAVSLCWDTSAPNYIEDDKIREATCKK
jgi:hypothetical protein